MTNGATGRLLPSHSPTIWSPRQDRSSCFTRASIHWRWRGRSCRTKSPISVHPAVRRTHWNIGERLSGTGRHSRRWAGARPSRQLRSRDKFDQSPSTDELPRATFECRRTLALSTAHWAHGPLDGHWDGLRARPRRIATGRACSLSRRPSQLNSRRHPMPSLYWDRLSRIVTISSLVRIPCIQPPRPCMKQKGGYRRYGRA